MPSPSTTERSEVAVRFIVVLASSVWVDEGKDLADRLLQHISGHTDDASRLSDAPVQALDLI